MDIQELAKFVKNAKDSREHRSFMGLRENPAELIEIAQARANTSLETLRRVIGAWPETTAELLLDMTTLWVVMRIYNPNADYDSHDPYIKGIYLDEKTAVKAMRDLRFEIMSEAGDEPEGTDVDREWENWFDKNQEEGDWTVILPCAVSLSF